MKFILINIISLLICSFLLDCSKAESIQLEGKEINKDTIQKKTYSTLPENKISKTVDGKITAQYISPTTIYNHAILGDNIEGGGLLYSINNEEYTHILTKNLVFEDIQPRLHDLDKDGIAECITILTNIEKGASVAVFKLEKDSLKLFAQSPYIGTPSRWLNIVSIDDLDHDGLQDISWIQTPHIGGILKIGNIKDGIINSFSEISGVSNHRIGSRNLCLSVTTNANNNKIIYVPSFTYDAIIGFQLLDKKWVSVDTIRKTVDPYLSLQSQHNFTNIQENLHCIF
jgi:hypothetical protein